MRRGGRFAGAALALALTSSACAVERDLDPARFACAQGGPCPAGDAGAVDAGSDDLRVGCAGEYSGYMYGDRAASLEASLGADGRLIIDVLGLTLMRRVSGQVDGAGSCDAADAVITFAGILDPSCTLAGTWTIEPDEGGTFTLAR